MRQPPGFETTGESRVCLLKKSIYGLKQSPRAWFDKFSKVVRDMGFTRNSADFFLFTRHRATGTVLLLVYVVDILLTGDDSKGIHAVKQHLSTVFQTKDLGHFRYFLGLEVARRLDGLVLSQRKYCLDLLKDAGQSGCKPATTPMEANHKLCAHASDDDLPLQNPKYYRRLVGKLIYLTVTRPDISFVVGNVSRSCMLPGFLISRRLNGFSDTLRQLRVKGCLRKIKHLGCKPKHSLDVNRKNGAANKGTRSVGTVRRLRMYNVCPKRDRKGKILEQTYSQKSSQTHASSPTAVGLTRKSTPDNVDEKALETVEKYSFFSTEETPPSSGKHPPTAAAKLKIQRRRTAQERRWRGDGERRGATLAWGWQTQRRRAARRWRGDGGREIFVALSF
ncbi:hypothetical protein KSP39_PZI022880 [Platanthera zijinensis]|uniref:Reverse transcriptase Ty1/copia-type domain-containing protein n=1 Tax=Platanthera zijinensis TaxID=2320716 RepID=A0AAP0AVW6_9ASPA